MSGEDENDITGIRPAAPQGSDGFQGGGCSPSGTGRPFLVYCPTNGGDHLFDFGSGDRLFDVALNDFSGTGTGTEGAEWHFAEVGHKWPCIARNLPRIERHYEFYAFLDNDVELDVWELNTLFLVGRALGLRLFQASLTMDSLVSHQRLRRVEGSFVRASDFVEVMMPVFSDCALARCARTFGDSESGWGLDKVWALYLEGRGMAVVDAVRARHRRPVASGGWVMTNGMRPWEEMEIVLAKHRALLEAEKVARKENRILVGICSCVRNEPKREAIRDSWLSAIPETVEAMFFVGGAAEVEGDVVTLPVNDGYRFLPAKVVAFFRWALANREFDWLFKCDDDTYVALDRLGGLIDREFELIGNEFVEARGAPSGGAGYLLSRELVRRLVEDGGLSARGAEDLMVGAGARRLGVAIRGDDRLRWNSERCPSGRNDLITSHWCSPERMRAIHADFDREPIRSVKARHRLWFDWLHFFTDGTFMREGSCCRGEWSESGDGEILLQWRDWNAERLTFGTDPPTVVPVGNPGVSAREER